MPKGHNNYLFHKTALGMKFLTRIISSIRIILLLSVKSIIVIKNGGQTSEKLQVLSQGLE